MNPSHLGLGTLKSLIPNKADVVDGAKLGIGAAAGILAIKMVQSRLPWRVPGGAIGELGVTALLALVGGGLVYKYSKSAGAGFIAAPIGVALASFAAGMMPAAVVPATPAAAESEAMSGFGFGMLGSGGSLGAMRIQDPSMLFGVGTPDMSASRMFDGATVAVEEGGAMSGASVAIETPSAFAGSLY